MCGLVEPVGDPQKMPERVLREAMGNWAVRSLVTLAIDKSDLRRNLFACCKQDHHIHKQDGASLARVIFSCSSRTTSSGEGRSASLSAHDIQGDLLAHLDLRGDEQRTGKLGAKAIINDGHSTICVPTVIIHHVGPPSKRSRPFEIIRHKLMGW